MNKYICVSKYLYTLCILLHTLAYSCILLYTLAYSCILLHTFAYSCILLHTLCILSQVLLEWCDIDSEGGSQREWVDLTNSDKFLSVYFEQDLLWARRVLPSEQQRAVAWPAKVSGTFSCKFWADIYKT